VLDVHTQFSIVLVVQLPFPLSTRILFQLQIWYSLEYSPLSKLEREAYYSLEYFQLPIATLPRVCYVWVPVRPGTCTCSRTKRGVYFQLTNLIPTKIVLVGASTTCTLYFEVL
jgi:hypothetical protein